MAEAAFKKAVQSKNCQDQFIIDSAGTINYHSGEKADTRSVKVCLKNGANDINDHHARKIEKDDFMKFDYIFCMDHSNYHDLMAIRPKDAKAKVKLFGSFDPSGETTIDDPYYGGLDGFDKNYKQVVLYSELFLKSLNL